jgi:hypothetical protein
MSTLKTNNVQVGQSVTATNNFTLYQPTTPDGTVRLGVGNSGATSADAVIVDNAGVFKFNSGYGSAAVAYGCRAWVNFNGTGTVAIRASGNVSSITDNGTGDYTVNFTTAMPDANYSVAASAGPVGNSSATHIADLTVGGPGTGTAPTTTAVRVIAFSIPHNVGADALYANVTIFR